MFGIGLKQKLFLLRLFKMSVLEQTSQKCKPCEIYRRICDAYGEICFSQKDIYKLAKHGFVLRA